MTAPVIDDWRVDALCREVGTELFFPDQEGDNGELAKQVCARCPVVAPCLHEALADPGLEGVWGGSTQQQRSQMRTGRLPGAPPELRVARRAPAGSGCLVECECGLSGCPGLVSRATKYRHAGMAGRGEQLMFRGAA